MQRYYLPSFGDKTINTITSATMEEYWEWRLVYGTTGPGADNHKVAKTPAGSTLNLEHTDFMAIMKWAFKQGMIERLPETEIPIKVKRDKQVARPAFTWPESLVSG